VRHSATQPPNHTEISSTVEYNSGVWAQDELNAVAESNCLFQQSKSF